VVYPIDDRRPVEVDWGRLGTRVLQYIYIWTPKPECHFSCSSIAVLQFSSTKMISPATLLLSIGVIGLAAANPRSHNSPDAKHGAVASESSVCSQIGIDTFRAGGNAADSVRKVFL
jgi:hypothetical protein